MFQRDKYVNKIPKAWLLSGVHTNLSQKQLCKTSLRTRVTFCPDGQDIDSAGH